MDYFWVVDYTESSKGFLVPVVMGGRCFTTEMAAQDFIDNANLSRKAEIFPLPTRDEERATSFIKGELVKRYGREGKGKWQKGIARIKHRT